MVSDGDDTHRRMCPLALSSLLLPLPLLLLLLAAPLLRRAAFKRSLVCCWFSSDRNMGARGAGDAW